MFLSKIGNVYYLYYQTDDGKRRRVSTKCRKKSNALSFLQHFKQDERDQQKKLKRISFKDFVAEYVQYSSGVHTFKTQRTYTTAFNEFLRIVGDIPIHTIGIKEIENFLSVKVTEASVWTARKYHIALRAAFEKAVQWECLAENPFRKVRQHKAPEIVPVYFSENEFTPFLYAIKEKNFRDLCLTGYNTGMRLGELISLKWKNIDFERKVIFICNSETFITKSKKNRVIPINDELYQLLLERKKTRRLECVTVFYSESGKQIEENYVTKTFKKYVRKAGLNDKLHFHSLRHSFASALVKSGVSLYSVQKFLGHSNSKTTEIYSHLVPQQLHSEVNKLPHHHFDDKLLQ